MPRRRHLDDAPRLPRGSWLRFSLPEMVRIVMVATALIALLVLQKPCARSVSKFVLGFQGADAGVDAPAAAAAPAPLPPGAVHLRTDMTPAELEAAIAAARGQIVDAGVDAPADAP